MVMGLAVTTTLGSVMDDLNVLMDLMKMQIFAQTVSFSFVFLKIKVFDRLYVRVGILHKCGKYLHHHIFSLREKA